MANFREFFETASASQRRGILSSTGDALKISFGDTETANLEICIPGREGSTQFHCHWDVLVSAAAFFAAIKQSKSKEALTRCLQLQGT